MFKSQLHAQMNSFQAFKNNLFISIGSDNLSAIGVDYSEWLATLVFLLGELHVQRSLAGYRPRGCKESDTTEQLTPFFILTLTVLFKWNHKTGAECVKKALELQLNKTHLLKYFLPTVNH